MRRITGNTLFVRALVAGLGLCTWYLIYTNLDSFARWITYQIFQLPHSSRLGSSVEFFIFEAPKVLMLLLLVAFLMGIVRTFFTAERTRKLLASSNSIRTESESGTQSKPGLKITSIAGNVLAALLGIVTPFCSCSAIPLFIGFVTTGVPLGVTFSFLISAPMINEIALVMLFGLFGWKVAGLYLITGLTIAITAGWAIGSLRLERFVESWVYESKTVSSPDCSTEETLTWSERMLAAKQSVQEIFGKVWLFVLLGIAVGAAIHGYVPQAFMASILGKNAWWSVPLAVLVGIPMYSNAAGIIPIIQALLEKGAALGTSLAFMMSVIGLSLPELIILKKVLRIQLIAIFVGIVFVGILTVGYLFNLIL